jgi:hypothetical protein
MQLGSRVLWGYSALPGILSRSPQLCQNGSFHFYLQSGKQRKVTGGHVRGVGWVGDESCCFLSKIPWWKGKCETVRCCDATASSFVAKVQVEVLAHFLCRHHKMSQQYAELTVWPAWKNSLWTIPLMPKKMMSMLLTLLLTCLAIFGLGEFGLFHWEYCCFVSRL